MHYILRTTNSEIDEYWICFTEKKKKYNTNGSYTLHIMLDYKLKIIKYTFGN